jgi:hypothetical protein
VVADASEADEDLVRRLGADVVIRRGPDLAGRIRAQFPDGVDGLADAALLEATILPAVRDRAFTKLASYCTIRSLPGNHRQFCGAIGICLWTSFAMRWNGMWVPI